MGPVWRYSEKHLRSRRTPRLGVHESRLDHIERLRYHHGNASSYRGCGKVQWYSLSCPRCDLEHLLYLVVGCIRSDGQQDCPGNGRHCAAEETGHALLFVDAEKAVENVLVAAEFVLII